MRKALKFLARWDVVWAPIFAFCGFLLMARLLQDVDPMSATYDPAYWHAAFFAGGLVAFASGAAQVGMWLNARGFSRYLYDGGWKEDWLSLTPAQRMLFAQAPYWIYLILMICVWCWLS